MRYFATPPIESDHARDEVFKTTYEAVVSNPGAKVPRVAVSETVFLFRCFVGNVVGIRNGVSMLVGLERLRVVRTGTSLAGRVFVAS